MGTSTYKFMEMTNATVTVTQKQILEELQKQGAIPSKGIIRILPQFDIEKIKRQFRIYRICEKHKVACLSRKAYRLHTHQEHAY